MKTLSTSPPAAGAAAPGLPAGPLPPAPRPDGAAVRLPEHAAAPGPDEMSEDALRRLVEEVNERLQGYHLQHRVERDERTSILVFQLVDKTTDKVIRQMPPKAILELAAALRERTGGLLDLRA